MATSIIFKNYYFCFSSTGPVVFPAGPPLGKETSGVRVGASGYGFVPPGGGRGKFTS